MSTKAKTAVDMILELTFGHTNVEFEIASIRCAASHGNDTTHNFHLVSLPVRVDNTNTIIGFMVESVTLTISGVVATSPETPKQFTVNLESGEFDCFVLEENTSEVAVLTMTMSLTQKHGKEVTLTKHFKFRRGMISHVQ